MSELPSKEFCIARRRNPYINLQDQALINRPFSTKQQGSIYHDVLKKKNNLFVPHVKSIDIDHMQRILTIFVKLLRV